jgi:hypothetical protein
MFVISSQRSEVLLFSLTLIHNVLYATSVQEALINFFCLVEDYG